MTYQEAVKYATAKLESISESCMLDAQLLICEACEIKPTKLYAHPEQTLPNKEGEKFDSLLEPNYPDHYIVEIKHSNILSPL